MNELLRNLKVVSNLTKTENGADTYASTLNMVYDLFAQGGAMRQASDSDCILMFKKAYKENPTLALKCLFYLRDIRGGQGERRFFRLCMNWLAKQDAHEVEHLIQFIPEFGRWDDLYSLVNTKAEAEMFKFIRNQMILDLESKTPSLAAKWLKSENASSKETKVLGRKTREAMNLSPVQYRKMLSVLRNRIRIVETLMSQNRWDEIEFDKLPSRAGILYKNAFARHDITRERYEKFIKDDNTKVNAAALYPYDVVKEACKIMGSESLDYWGLHYEEKPMDNIDRLAVNKYWDNLTDYFNGATLNALAVVDTSGSMTSGMDIRPIDVAISLGLYCAERAKGPFENHFISFSETPQLIECEGVDFCDKVARIYRRNECSNTNIEATFDLILNTARKAHLAQKDLPENLIIISDMQFDAARGYYSYYHRHSPRTQPATLMENIRAKWKAYGYVMPNLIFWNVNADYEGSIPMKDEGGITFVSGASPVIFEMIMTGRKGQDLMLDKLLSERYSKIVSCYEHKLGA